MKTAIFLWACFGKELYYLKLHFSNSFTNGVRPPAALPIPPPFVVPTLLLGT